MINITVNLDIYDSTGAIVVTTVSLGSISNVKPTKFKLHQTPFTLPLSATGLPSSHCRIRLGTTTKLGLFEVESGDFIIGSPGLLPNSVDTTHIIDGQVQTADIGDGEVRTADIFDGGVATVDIANNAVTGAKLLSDATDDSLRAVNTNHIKDVAVTNAKIANSAVDANKLATDAVTTAKILDGAVTTNKIADGNVTLAKLPTTTAGRIIIAQNAAPPSYIAMNGDATLDASGLLDLANLAVETAEINDLAVTSGKLANDAVTTAKILDGQITTAKIGNGQIQNANIADGAVDTNKIQNGTIVAGDLEATFNASLHRHIDNKNVALVGNAGGTIFLTSTANSTSSGAFLVGAFDEFTNSSNTNVQGVLKDFDTALNTALVAQNLFSQVNVPSGDSVISANSPTTQLTLTSPVGSGITVTGNNTTKTITLDVAAKAFDGDDLADSVAGDGLFYSGSGPRVLNVGAAVNGAITVNANDLGVSADGIDGIHLATNITVDDITQTFTFGDTNSPLMLYSFTGLGSLSNVPVFRITRGSGPATSIFTVDSDGDITTPGFYTGANGVNVSGGFLTTGPVLTPNFSVNSANGNTTVGGTLTVTGGLSATSLSSDTDFILDIDKNNDGGSANFTVRNNNAEVISQLTVSDSVSVTESLGTTTMPARVSLSDGSSNTGLLQTAALSANRTYTFPNQDGTVAMLSDITANVEAAGAANNTLRSNGTTWVNNANFTVTAAGAATAVSYAGDGSALTNLEAGDIATGTLAVARGGTGVDGSAATNGQLLIGHDANNNFSLANLTGTANQVTVTNGAGTITLSGPQDLAATSTPTFGRVTLGDESPIPGRVILRDNAVATNTGTIETAATLAANRTYTLPDASGTFLLASGGALPLGDDTTPTAGSLVLEDSTALNTFQGSLQVTNPLTADRVYTFPNATGTVALTSDITATNLTGIVPLNKGGTGLNIDGTTVADLDFLVGDNATDAFIRKTLQGTANQVVVTNNAGTVVLSTPQNIAPRPPPPSRG
ncbi:MAG: hypothetical protein L6R28_06100 [Planctomycetes bacterium]|nr:hypothetical protein [Planctomycetota bacterium]